MTETDPATEPSSETVKPPIEVVVGEIPSSHDIAHMLWTARCSEPEHDLLGHFESREEAEQARTQHLKAHHEGVR